MLVLSRKAGEEIAIDGVITIRVLSIERGVVRLGIEAPRGVSIHRRELYRLVERLNHHAAMTEPSPLVTALRRTRLYSLQLPAEIPTVLPETPEPHG